jgi:hypothetical protein
MKLYHKVITEICGDKEVAWVYHKVLILIKTLNCLKNLETIKALHKAKIKIK